MGEVAPTLESAAAESPLQHQLSVSSIQREKIQHLLLLKHVPKPLPKWMKHYRLASYIAYALIACYSWVYLLYIGTYQANPRMQIQFTSVVTFLELNSYSILSPLLCSVFMGVLAYHVLKRIQLDDGDFFGLLGILLFFALVNLHDGYGIFKLVDTSSRDYNIQTKDVIDPPPRDFSSRIEYHWQYAWSTRPSCARKYVRDLIYQHDYDKRHLKRQILVEFLGAQSRSQQISTASAGTSQMDCNKFHDNPANAKIRQWMRDLQNEFKCCGPYGYLKWQTWFDAKEKTGCDESWITNTTSGNIPNCYDPLVRWLNTIFYSSFGIMLTQCILYILSMFFACLHYAAMKYEHAAVEKKYSLLDMSDPAKEEPTDPTNEHKRSQSARAKKASKDSRKGSSVP